MDVKDLMIGDWAEFHCGYGKVTGITDAGVHFEDRFGSGIASGAEPIPLTPEILEKNGFTRSNERVRYFSESTDYYDVDIHEITDSIWCFEYQNCEAHFPPYLILIAHVHELQHALKLCGIEKEIQL